MVHNPESSGEESNPEVELQKIGILGRFNQINTSNLSEHIGGLAVVGTPFYLTSQELFTRQTEDKKVLSAHEICHNFVAQHLVPNQPQVKINPILLTEDQVVKIGLGDYRDEAKSWLSVLNMDISRLNPEILIDLPDLLERRVDFISRIFRVDNPDLIKAAINNLILDRYKKDLERRQQVSNDFEEGLVTYISNAAIKGDHKPWELHQDDSKTAFTLAFRRRFKDVTEVVDFIKDHGYEQFVEKYKDEIGQLRGQAMQTGEVKKAKSQKVTEIEKTDLPRQEEQDIIKEKLSLFDRVQLLAGFELIEEHQLMPIESSSLTHWSRNNFIAMANYFRHLRGIMPGIVDGFLDELETRCRYITESYAPDPIISTYESIHFEFLDNSVESLPRYFYELGFDHIDDLLNVPLRCDIDSDGAIIDPTVNSITDLEDRQKVILLFANGPKSKVNPLCTDMSYHVVSITRVNDRANFDIHRVLVPIYRQDSLGQNETLTPHSDGGSSKGTSDPTSQMELLLKLLKMERSTTEIDLEELNQVRKDPSFPPVPPDFDGEGQKVRVAILAPENIENIDISEYLTDPFKMQWLYADAEKNDIIALMILRKIARLKNSWGYYNYEDQQQYSQHQQALQMQRIRI